MKTKTPWEVWGASGSGRVYVFKTRAEADQLASAAAERYPDVSVVFSPTGERHAPKTRRVAKMGRSEVKERTTRADVHLAQAQAELSSLMTIDLRANHPKTYALVVQEYEAIEKVRRLIRSMP